ncbi:MAG: glycine zipper 2TM domain-containing protein [Cardiobacteriaceae bacterium]|nr:glycine zipper 2TM domain-containing protein [Cardiobacteriaceae bacterium]
MKKIMKTSMLCVLMASSLTACVNHGTRFDMGQVSQIQRNVTTEQQIRMMFGEPVGVQTNLKAGTKVLTYQYKNDDSLKKEMAGLGGALLGGLIGAQIGDGSGQYIATGLGAMAGGAVANNMVDAREEMQILTVVISTSTGYVIDFNFEESKGRTQSWGLNGGVGTL